jgi:hypothetical protein
MTRSTFKNSLQGALALGLLVFVSLGCSRVAEKMNEVAQENSNRPVSIFPGSPDPDKDPDGRLYEDSESITDFVTKLTAAVGNDNPNILKIAMYDSYASAQVQDPAKPENIDSYTYTKGKLSEAKPVKILGSGKISDNVFPLKDVNLAGIPELTKEMMRKLAEVEGGKMVGYTVERGLPFSKDIRVTPLSDSSRKSVSAQADKNAKLKKFEVN